MRLSAEPLVIRHSGTTIAGILSLRSRAARTRVTKDSMTSHSAFNFSRRSYVGYSCSSKATMPCRKIGTMAMAGEQNSLSSSDGIVTLLHSPISFLICDRLAAIHDLEVGQPVSCPAPLTVEADRN